MKYNGQVIPQFGTCYDRWVVVSCAKCWPDQISATGNFTGFQLWAYEFFVTWIPSVLQRSDAVASFDIHGSASFIPTLHNICSINSLQRYTPSRIGSLVKLTLYESVFSIKKPFDVISWSPESIKRSRKTIDDKSNKKLNLQNNVKRYS